MNRMFGKGKEDLQYLNSLKRRVLYCIIALMVLLQVFASASLNLRKLRYEKQEASFLIVDFKKSSTLEEKEALEGELWKDAAVRQLQYVSKERSFQNLQEELNISIPMKDNPLSDSLLVYMTAGSEVEELQSKIEKSETVKEVFRDEAYSQQMQKNNRNYHLLTGISLGVAVLLALLILFLFRSLAAYDFLNCINVIPDNQYNLSRAKRRNLIPFTLSTLFATLLFLNVYAYFRTSFLLTESSFVLLGLRRSILWHMGIFVLVNLIVWLLPLSLRGMEGEEE